jgi:hypothetical protein
MTSMEERDRCYSFILSRTPHETFFFIYYYFIKLVGIFIIPYILSKQSRSQSVKNSTESQKENLIIISLISFQIITRGSRRLRGLSSVSRPIGLHVLYCSQETRRYNLITYLRGFMFPCANLLY